MVNRLESEVRRLQHEKESLENLVQDLQRKASSQKKVRMELFMCIPIAYTHCSLAYSFSNIVLYIALLVA